MAAEQIKRSVVITGLGIVSPIGIGRHCFSRALREGKSGIDEISLFDASHLPTRFAGEVKDFSPEELLSGWNILTATRERRILMANAAARLAVEDARLDADTLAGTRSGIILGSGIHPVIPDMSTVLSFGIYQSLFDDPEPDPGQFAEAISKETSGENCRYPVFNRTNEGVLSIAQQYRIAGTCYSVVSACAAATQAIGLSCRLIQRGDADIVLAGGYDSMIFNFGVYAFCLLGLMSTHNENPQTAMKPFDRNRDGFALGEGAAVLILEEKTRALKRGAPLYGEIAGYGSSVDAYQVTDPHPEGTGAVLAMREALADAQMNPQQIEYINAHGTATPKNDRIETRAIKEVFGSHAYQIPVSSTKSMIGHIMAAGGALELIATCLGMHEGFVPPTINYETPDPDCDLDYVPNAARAMKITAALSNSFGLGGQNASIIVRTIS
jgi:3-oxoacyl-[acyl-carrier-protein] synthase II